MNFIDTAYVHIEAGDGGKGHVSFRRLKFAPKGGPDGGNGGHGGDIILQADRQLGTLLDLTYKRRYIAKSGDPGGKDNCTGKSGPDIVIRVPCGTVIRNKQTGDQIVDMDRDGSTLILAKGGRGGRGNAEFVSSINQVPRYSEPGTPGEKLDIELELKLLADVGLVGLPNAGKSTLISVISAARPKIADYPFTTLIPNLGLVRVGDNRSYTVADIPGLIEGAHTGKGLGHQFLRHIERTAILAYLIDGTSDDPEQDLRILQDELFKYDEVMRSKPFIVVLTKADMMDPDQLKELEQSSFVRGHRARIISAVSGTGIKELVEALWPYVAKQRELSGREAAV